MTPPLIAERQVETLDLLLERVAQARARGGEPIAVFDLDDTLLSTDHRHVRILREFALAINADEPEAAWKLARVEAGQLRYAIADTARAAGVADEPLLAALRDYWFTRFFRNDYLRCDEPIPGAAEFCQEAKGRGAVVVYMTGRDVTMRDGTVHALERHGFPLPDAETTRLILKPRFDTPDLEFKTSALRELEALGEVVGAFENEPSHINLFHGAFPSAVNVFVDTKHSGKPVSPHPALPWIRDFRRA